MFLSVIHRHPNAEIIDGIPDPGDTAQPVLTAFVDEYLLHFWVDAVPTGP